MTFLTGCYWPTRAYQLRQFIKNVGHCKNFAAAILAAHIGLRGSFVQQLIVGSMGQCEGLHDISYRLLLADSSPSVEGIH